MTIKEFVLECNKLMHRNTGMNLYESEIFLDFQLKKYKENADVTYTIEKLLKDINESWPAYWIDNNNAF